MLAFGDRRSGVVSQENGSLDGAGEERSGGGAASEPSPDAGAATLPLVPVPVPRTRPWGVPDADRAPSDPPLDPVRASEPPDNVIRGGAAANPALDALVGGQPVPEERVGTVIAARYRLDRRLGAGGVGDVYLASALPEERRVAVKLLRRELGLLPEVVALFEREAAAASRIDHPNVAGALDFGRLQDGSLYLVLEYVAGASLAEVLASEGPLETARALRIARAIAAALGAAHRAGIVHRDLKPENVMLTERPGPETVKVVDFGVAQLPAECSTRVTPALRATFTGTPEYMAPEQAAGTIVDHRADLNTLGVVLYAMLAGHPPFRDETMEAVLRRQIAEPPPPLPARVDAGAAALTMTLLAKDPDHRPPTADDVVRRIDELVAPEAGAEAESEPRPASSSRSPASSTSRSTASSRVARVADPAPGPASSAGATSSRRPGARPVPPAPEPRTPRPRLLLWLVVVTVTLLLVLIGAGAATRSRRAAVGLAPSRPSAPPSEVELARIAARAATGDAAALVDLERARPLSAPALRALGRGYAARGAASRSVAAYARALQLDPTLADEPVIARDVRRAIDDPAASEAALELASARLGTRGLDVVFDAWSAARQDTARTALATRSKRLLDDPRVARRASPALRVALALWAGTSCESYRALLPQVVVEGDARSLPVLNALARTQGCGPQQRRDCFACLRGDDLLARATAAAAARPAPDL